MVTIGHLRVTIGHLRVTIGHLRVTIGCLLYTSDAADDLLCVDLGGRRIIKKKYIYIYIYKVVLRLHFKPF